MKLRETITEADKVRPNDLTAERKARYVFELEGEFAEMMQIDPPQNPFPEDCELLIQAPHEDVYVLWLCAKIDNDQEESDLYMNDMAVFNAALADTKAYYRRHHRPKKHYGVRV